MKRVLSLVLTLLLLVSLIPAGAVEFSLTAKAEEYTYGYYTYTVSNGEATITAVDNINLKGSITVPSTLGGYPVRTIGRIAFYRAAYITSLTLPSSLRTVEEYAFEDCRGMESVTFQYGVTSIGLGAFYQCEALTTVNLPESVKTIGDAAFQLCKSLAAITFPDSVTYMGCDLFVMSGVPENAENYDEDGAFYSGKHLIDAESVTGDYVIREGTKTIAGNAFNRSNVTAITVPNSVVMIGDYAFSECSSLTSLTIGNGVQTVDICAFDAASPLETVTVAAGNSLIHSAGNCLIHTASRQLWLGTKNSVIPTDGTVTSIAKYAFSGSDVAAITIPAAVKAIERMAFYDCTALTSVTLENGVESIGEQAFLDCTALTAIDFPASVTAIENGALEGCTVLKSITVNTDNTVYRSAGNCLISKADAVVLLGCSASVIPADGSVKGIGDYAFSRTAISEITIPEGVTHIGAYAFYYCDQLAAVTLPNSLTSIDASAFSLCTALAQLNFGSGVETIGGNAFVRCEALTALVIPDSVKTIGYSAFSGCTALTKVTVGNGVESVGNSAFSNCTALAAVVYNAANCTTFGSAQYPAFSGCTVLKTLTIGEDVVTIPQNLTAGCTVLATVNYNAKNCVKIGDYTTSSTVFSSCAKMQVVNIGKNVQTMPAAAFANCKVLITVRFNATNCTQMGTISYPVFEGCTKLNKVIVGNTVTTIPDNAFMGCTKLATLTMGTAVETIGSNAFIECEAITELTLPATVTSIGDGAFGNCYSLANVYYGGSRITRSDITIGNCNTYLTDATWHYAVAGCDHPNTTVKNAQDATCNEDGYTGDTVCNDCGETVQAGEVISATGHTYTDNGDASCDVCGEYRYITYTVTDGKVTITKVDAAVSGEFVIPSTLDGYPVTTIGNSAFYQCTALTAVTVPESVTAIEAAAFYQCTALAAVTIPQGVKSIGYAAFRECASLTRAVIPDSVQSIGEGAFYGCSSLTAVTLSSNLTCIENWMFYGCNALLAVTIPQGVTAIGDYAFYYCASLTEAVIPNGVQSIGNTAFRACTKLTTVTIPNSVQNISEYAFYDCTALSDVHYDGNVTDRAGITVAAHNDALLSATWHYAVCEHQNTAIRNAQNATCTENGYTGDTVCGDCGETLVRGTVISATGEHAFADDADISCDACGELRYVTYYIANGNATILSADATISGAVDIPATIKGATVTAIAQGAFADCTAMTSVSIPGGVTYIGSGAFDGCSGLTKVCITDLSAWCRITFADAAANPLYNAKKLYLNGSELKHLVIPDDVDEVKEYTFTYCTSLTSVTVPPSVKYIGAWAFRSNSAMTSLTLSEGLVGIGSRAFDYCIKLTELNLPHGVITIGDRAFMQGSNLASVALPRSVKTIGELAFSKCTKLTAVFYGGDETDRAVMSIGASNDPLTDATWQYTTCAHSDVVYADKAATCTEDGYVNGQVCADCGDLLAADEVVSAAGEHVFADTADIVCDQCGDVRYITYYVVDDRATILSADTAISGAVEIPDSIAGARVVAIGNEAFKDCTAMTSVSIPSTVSYIGSGAFDGCTGLAKVNITDLSAWCRITFANTTSNPLYNARKLYLNGEAVKDLVIPADIFEVKDYTFTYCTSITSITVPSHVKRIGAYAFRSGTRLTSLTIEEGVESIGSYAFNYCLYISTVTLPESLVTIEDHAFMQVAMTTVTLPRSVKTIGAYAFNKCNKLTDVYYGGAEEDLAGITIGDNNAPLTDATWHYTTCTHANTQTVGDVDATCTENGYSGDTVCADCGEVLASGETVLALGHTEVTDEAVIPGCTTSGLTAGVHCGVCGEVLTAQEVVPALGHTEVTDEAVEPTCTTDGLTAGVHCGVCGEVLTAQEVVPALGHTEVTDEAVEPGCTTSGLTAGVHCSVCGEVLTAQEIVPAIGHAYTDAYDSVCDVCGADCNADAFTYTVTEGKVTINKVDAAVRGEVNIPATLDGYPVTEIAKDAFRNCRDMMTVTIPVGVTSIGQNAFKDCIGLEKVYYYAANCTTMGVSAYPAFNGCTALTTVYIGKTVTQIPAQAFRGATGLTTVYITKNTKTINKNAFYLCDVLTTVHYVGSASEAMAVDVKSFNTAYTNATFSYNSPCFDEHEWTAACDAFCDLCMTRRATTHENVVDDPYVAPTCTEIGLTAGSHCAVCGNIVVPQTVIAELGHVWDDGVILEAPANGTPGKKMYTCTVCGDTKTVEVTNATIIDGYYYEDGVLVKNAGLVKVEDAYYFITASGAVKTGRHSVTNTNGLPIEKGIYHFFNNGKMNQECAVYAGYYYNDQGKSEPYAGLIEWRGSKYYIGGGGKVTTGRYFITKLNGLLPKARAYTFFDDGRMLEDNRVHTDGYYYENGLRVPYAGLIEYEGSYYYIADSGKYTTGRKFISNMNNTGKVKGYYYFDSNGKMLTGQRVVYGYYYEDGYAPSYVGLVKVNAYYYYVQLNGAVVKNNDHFLVSKPNGLVDKGYYAFDENGRMVL